MTLQNMCEIVKQQFPEKLEAQIKLDLNGALALYSEETRLPFSRITVTIGSDGAFHTDTGAITLASGRYSLPLTVRDIIDVNAYDAQGNEVDQPDYHIDFLGRSFAILDSDNLLYQGGGFPASITELVFLCSIQPDILSADTDAPTYPEAFHQGLIDHVLAKYYGYKGILQQSGWFRSSYQASVASGKKYFNRNRE